MGKGALRIEFDQNGVPTIQHLEGDVPESTRRRLREILEDGEEGRDQRSERGQLLETEQPGTTARSQDKLPNSDIEQADDASTLEVQDVEDVDALINEASENEKNSEGIVLADAGMGGHPMGRQRPETVDPPPELRAGAPMETLGPYSVRHAPDRGSMIKPPGEAEPIMDVLSKEAKGVLDRDEADKKESVLNQMYPKEVEGVESEFSNQGQKLSTLLEKDEDDKSQTPFASLKKADPAQGGNSPTLPPPRNFNKEAWGMLTHVQQVEYHSLLADMHTAIDRRDYQQLKRLVNRLRDLQDKMRTFQQALNVQIQPPGQPGEGMEGTEGAEGGAGSETGGDAGAGMEAGGGAGPEMGGGAPPTGAPTGEPSLEELGAQARAEAGGDMDGEPGADPGAEEVGGEGMETGPGAEEPPVPEPGGDIGAEAGGGMGAEEGAEPGGEMGAESPAIGAEEPPEVPEPDGTPDLGANAPESGTKAPPPPSGGTEEPPMSEAQKEVLAEKPEEDARAKRLREIPREQWTFEDIFRSQVNEGRSLADHLLRNSQLMGKSLIHAAAQPTQMGGKQSALRAGYTPPSAASLHGSTQFPGARAHAAGDYYHYGNANYHKTKGRRARKYEIRYWKDSSSPTGTKAMMKMDEGHWVPVDKHMSKQWNADAKRWDYSHGNHGRDMGAHTQFQDGKDKAHPSNLALAYKHMHEVKPEEMKGAERHYVPINEEFDRDMLNGKVEGVDGDKYKNALKFNHGYEGYLFRILDERNRRTGLAGSKGMSEEQKAAHRQEQAFGDNALWEEFLKLAQSNGELRQVLENETKKRGGELREPSAKVRGEVIKAAFDVLNDKQEEHNKILHDVHRAHTRAYLEKNGINPNEKVNLHWHEAQIDGTHHVKLFEGAPMSEEKRQATIAAMENNRNPDNIEMKVPRQTRSNLYTHYHEGGKETLPEEGRDVSDMLALQRSRGEKAFRKKSISNLMKKQRQRAEEHRAAIDVIKRMNPNADISKLQVAQGGRVLLFAGHSRNPEGKDKRYKFTINIMHGNNEKEAAQLMRLIRPWAQVSKLNQNGRLWFETARGMMRALEFLHQLKGVKSIEELEKLPPKKFFADLEPNSHIENTVGRENKGPLRKTFPTLMLFEKGQIHYKLGIEEVVQRDLSGNVKLDKKGKPVTREVMTMKPMLTKQQQLDLGKEIAILAKGAINDFKFKHHGLRDLIEGDKNLKDMVAEIAAEEAKWALTPRIGASHSGGFIPQEVPNADTKYFNNVLARITAQFSGVQNYGEFNGYNGIMGRVLERYVAQLPMYKKTLTAKDWHKEQPNRLVSNERLAPGEKPKPEMFTPSKEWAQENKHLAEKFYLNERNFKALGLKEKDAKRILKNITEQIDEASQDHNAARQFAAREENRLWGVKGVMRYYLASVDFADIMQASISESGQEGIQEGRGQEFSLIRAEWNQSLSTLNDRIQASTDPKMKGVLQTLHDGLKGLSDAGSFADREVALVYGQALEKMLGEKIPDVEEIDFSKYSPEQQAAGRELATHLAPFYSLLGRDTSKFDAEAGTGAAEVASRLPQGDWDTPDDGTGQQIEDQKYPSFGDFNDAFGEEIADRMSDLRKETKTLHKNYEEGLEDEADYKKRVHELKTISEMMEQFNTLDDAAYENNYYDMRSFQNVFDGTAQKLQSALGEDADIKDAHEIMKPYAGNLYGMMQDHERHLPVFYTGAGAEPLKEPEPAPEPEAPTAPEGEAGETETPEGEPATGERNLFGVLQDYREAYEGKMGQPLPSSLANKLFEVGREGGVGAAQKMIGTWGFAKPEAIESAMQQGLDAPDTEGAKDVAERADFEAPSKHEVQRAWPKEQIFSARMTPDARGNAQAHAKNLREQFAKEYEDKFDRKPSYKLMDYLDSHIGNITNQNGLNTLVEGMNNAMAITGGRKRFDANFQDVFEGKLQWPPEKPSFDETGKYKAEEEKAPEAPEGYLGKERPFSGTIPPGSNPLKQAIELYKEFSDRYDERHGQMQPGTKIFDKMKTLDSPEKFREFAEGLNNVFALTPDEFDSKFEETFSQGAAGAGKGPEGAGEVSFSSTLPAGSNPSRQAFDLTAQFEEAYEKTHGVAPPASSIYDKMGNVTDQDSLDAFAQGLNEAIKVPPTSQYAKQFDDAFSGKAPKTAPEAPGKETKAPEATEPPKDADATPELPKEAKAAPDAKKETPVEPKKEPAATGESKELSKEDKEALRKKHAIPAKMKERFSYTLSTPEPKGPDYQSHAGEQSSGFAQAYQDQWGRELPAEAKAYVEDRLGKVRGPATMDLFVHGLNRAMHIHPDLVTDDIKRAFVRRVKPGTGKETKSSKKPTKKPIAKKTSKETTTKKPSTKKTTKKKFVGSGHGTTEQRKKDVLAQRTPAHLEVMRHDMPEEARGNYNLFKRGAETAKDINDNKMRLLENPDLSADERRTIEGQAKEAQANYRNNMKLIHELQDEHFYKKDPSERADYKQIFKDVASLGKTAREVFDSIRQGTAEAEIDRRKLRKLKSSGFVDESNRLTQVGRIADAMLTHKYTKDMVADLVGEDVAKSWMMTMEWDMMNDAPLPYVEFNETEVFMEKALAEIVQDTEYASQLFKSNPAYRPIVRAIIERKKQSVLKSIVHQVAPHPGLKREVLEAFIGLITSDSESMTGLEILGHLHHGYQDRIVKSMDYSPVIPDSLISRAYISQWYEELCSHPLFKSVMSYVMADALDSRVQAFRQKASETAIRSFEEQMFQPINV